MGKIPLLVAERGAGAILKGGQVSEQEQDFWRIHGVGFYFKVKFFGWKHWRGTRPAQKMLSSDFRPRKTISVPGETSPIASYSDRQVLQTGGGGLQSLIRLALKFEQG